MSSLAELKRKNAEAEAAANPVTEEVQDVEQDEVIEEVETEQAEAGEELDDSSDEQEAETELESWMTSDDESESDEQSVPLSKHISLRSKLKDKVREKDSENEQLRAEIEKLKQSKSATETKATLQPPKLEDYQGEYGDTDFAGFNEANAKYMQDLVDSRLTGNTKKQDEEAKQQQLQKQRETTVNHHYELAEKLIQQGTLKADDYISADIAIVNTLEASVPGQGRAVADGLIQHLSEVSDQPEKVWFKLGKDPKLLNQVIDAYQADPSGVKGVALLARISQKYVAPAKRKSTAPKPASKVQGDVTANSDAAKLQRKYNDAHKKRKTADAFRIKREAKKAGVDTSKW